MHIAKLFLVVMKSGNNYCRLPLKAPEEDKEIQGATSLDGKG